MENLKILFAFFFIALPAIAILSFLIVGFLEIMINKIDK